MENGSRLRLFSAQVTLSTAATVSVGILPQDVFLSLIWIH